MPDLSAITAICVDTRNHELALSACAEMAKRGFAQIVLVSDASIERHLPSATLPPGLRIEHIAPLRGRQAYSRYILRHLSDHVRTEHALIFQWDGFVLRPDLWRPEFLGYDYVGAVHTPDHGLRPGRRVGNGGFCLRSARLLKAVAQIAPLDTDTAEDLVICDVLADQLEQEYGMRFAPPQLAKHFSVDMMSLPQHRKQEPDLVADQTFGFHGFCNFHLVFDDDELLELVDTRLGDFRGELLTSRPAAALMVNLASSGRARAAMELSLRAANILEMDLRFISVADVVARCQHRHVA